MTDQFVDSLFSRLQGEGRSADAPSPESQQLAARLVAAKADWWAAFVDVLGHKVGAWNEKDRSAPPVHFTRHADGSASISHGHAQLSCDFDGDQVVVHARLGTLPARAAPTILLADNGRGGIVATYNGDGLTSPTAAAEAVIMPLLSYVFRGR